MRGAICATIYRKNLFLSVEARGRNPSGDVQNMISIDAQKVADMAQWLHMAYSAVIQVVGAIIVMVRCVAPCVVKGGGYLRPIS